MSAASITNATHQTALSSAPDLNAREENHARPVDTMNKVAALAVLLIAAVVITVSCLALPFPASLTISLIVGAIAISLFAAAMSDCHSVTVVDGRPYRSHYWHNWWSPPLYTTPIVVNPIYRSSPVIVSGAPHVRVGGGHSIFPTSVAPSFRSTPHVRVGGGHGISPTRMAPSFRSTPHVRVGGGHFQSSARSVPSIRSGGASSFSFNSGGPRVAVGSRRH